MAIPRDKSSPSSPSPSSPADNPSVNPSVNPSTGADTDKSSKAAVDKTVAKTEQLEPVSVPPPSDTVLPSPVPSPVPHPAVAVPSLAVTSVPVSDDDLPSILRRLTPIQRAKLRSAAISEGVIQGGVGGGRENPDGSLSVMIRVDGDLVPQLKTWAEEANKNLSEMVQELVGMLLSSYLLSPWEASQPVNAAEVK